MKFIRQSSVTAISECGRFEVRAARNLSGKPFYNAYDLRTDKHVGASFNMTQVSEECERYLARQVSAAA